MHLQLSLALALALLTSASNAGPLQPMQMSGQALQYMKAGKIDGCGIRVVGLSDFTVPSATVYVADVSVNIYTGGTGVVKGGFRQTSAATVLANSGAGVKTAKRAWIRSIWLRSAAGDATTKMPNAPALTADDPAALMYLAADAPVLAVMTAIMTANGIQIGGHFVGDDLERIFYGSVSIEQADKEQFMECFRSLMDSMEKGARSPK